MSANPFLSIFLPFESYLLILTDFSCSAQYRFSRFWRIAFFGQILIGTPSYTCIKEMTLGYRWGSIWNSAETSITAKFTPKLLFLAQFWKTLSKGSVWKSVIACMFSPNFEPTNKRRLRQGCKSTSGNLSGA